MTTAPKDAPVIIVGGGPVGLGLAISLGQRGVRCIVVERSTQLHHVPRGQNLTQRTMEHFHFWGAEKQLRAARTVPGSYGIGGLIAYRTFVSGYAYDWMQRGLMDQYYYTSPERLPQYATEAVLRARVAEIPAIKFINGWGAVGVSQDADGVQVQIAQTGGEGRRTLTGDYVVGCDGARSVVRESSGITQTRSDHDRLMVLLVFRSQGLNTLLERFPGKSFYCVLNPEHKGYWQFFGRVDLDGTFFFHAPVPLGTTRENFDFKAYVHSCAGAEFDVEFEHIGFWDLRIANADVYGLGRAFIAGDACHSHPPYGGYGVNTGFEDAANLGWKLAATIQGWGGPGLLDSYSAERQPVFASLGRDFIGKAIEVDREFLDAYDPAQDRAAFEQAWQERSQTAVAEVDAYEPSYEGSPIVWSGPGQPTAVGRHQFDARAGHHLAPLPLTAGGNVFDALGEGFTLAAFGAREADVAAFRAASAATGVPLTVVTDTRAEGRDRYGAALVLVRPDQYVAWAGEEAGDAAGILKKAAGF